MDAAAVQRLEELAFTALPALETERYDGWVLRAAGGYTGRANSAAPLYPGRLALDKKLAYLEDWYWSRGLRPSVRLTDAAEPPELDELLAERGYTVREGAVSVRARPLDGNDYPPDAVEVFEGPMPTEWLEALARFQPRVAEHFDAVRDLFSRLPRSSAFALIRHQAEPAALGRAVSEDGHVGLFDVFTRDDLRNRGLATDLTLALLSWGAAHGARQAYLQVLTVNDPAHQLYDRLGFREVYRYWYRELAGGVLGRLGTGGR